MQKNIQAIAKGCIFVTSLTIKHNAMLDIKNVLVTNYSKGLKGVKAIEMLKAGGKKIEFDPISMELSINDNLFIHVFDKLPYIPNSNNNKSWFNSDIYHFS